MYKRQIKTFVNALFVFELLLQNRNTLFSFFLKSFLILFEKQQRRWAIENNCGGDVELFRQEYPACPEEAFLSTGSCIFDKAALRCV